MNKNNNINFLENITLLYAEDDHEIQKEISRTLKFFKINVILANNGYEGINLFNSNRNNIDIVLTDIKMPKLNGIDMIKEIRSLDKYIPIIISSAYEDNSFLKASIQLGVSGYVLKPLDIYKLKEALEKAIEPKKLKDIIVQKNILLKKQIIENEKKHKIMIHQSKFASMGEMINMIAHQWRQPLASIGTASFNIKNKIQTNKFDLNKHEDQIKQNSFFIKKLDEIEFYVQNLTTTIDDFSNFYKSNKHMINISINTPIINALNILDKSLSLNNIKINKQLKSKKKLNLFSNEIMHVIINIIKNSEDNFIEKNLQNKIINIVTEDIDNYVLVKISDNGLGIKEYNLDKIFNPYFSTKKEKNGTGIGLYMSKVIIEQNHKGIIQAENNENGVRFDIKILSK